MKATAAAAAFLAIASAASSPAAAQPTLPTRDVTIVYRVEGGAHAAVPGGLPDRVRIDWNAARQRIRLEPEGRAQALLIDLAAPSVHMVDSGLHVAMALPVRPADLDPVRLQDARLTRRGRATVAGLPCTDYAVESRRGQGTICFTDDGVPLRAVGTVNGNNGSFTALSVSFVALPPSNFDIPHGFMSLTVPPGLGRF